MKRSTLMWSILGTAAILVLIDWYFVSPLFFKREIDYPYPTDLPIPTILTATPRATLAAPPTPITIATNTPHITPTPIHVNEVAPSATFTVTAKPKSNPIATPTPTASSSKSILGQGNFVDGGVDGALIYKGTGLATIYHTPDDSYLLRFDDFIITNGPDLRVLLSPKAVPIQHDDRGEYEMGEYVELGALKHNVGDQNYAIPAHINPTAYKSVIIYCATLKTIFAIAELQ